MLPLIHRLKLLTYSLEPVASWDIEPDLVREAIAEIERLSSKPAGVNVGVLEAIRDALAETFSKDDPAQLFISDADKRARAPVLWAYEQVNAAIGVNVGVSASSPETTADTSST